MALFSGLQGYNFPNSDWFSGGSNNFIGPSMPVSSYVDRTSDVISGLNLGNTQTGNGFLGNFGGLGGMLGGLTGLMQGAGALWNAYNGMKAMEMAQDQFGFQKRLANRNIANQAKIINNTYDNAAQVAAGMIGGKDADGNYGFTDQAVVDRYASRARDRHVDGSTI